MRLAEVLNVFSTIISTRFKIHEFTQTLINFFNTIRLTKNTIFNVIETYITSYFHIADIPMYRLSYLLYWRNIIIPTAQTHYYYKSRLKARFKKFKIVSVFHSIGDIGTLLAQTHNARPHHTRHAAVTICLVADGGRGRGHSGLFLFGDWKSCVHRTAWWHWPDGRLLDDRLRVSIGQVRSAFRRQWTAGLARTGIFGSRKSHRGRLLSHVGRLERDHWHVGEYRVLGSFVKDTFIIVFK